MPPPPLHPHALRIFSFGIPKNNGSDCKLRFL